jgi:hypothetical protein
MVSYNDVMTTGYLIFNCDDCLYADDAVKDIQDRKLKTFNTDNNTINIVGAAASGLTSSSPVMGSEHIGSSQAKTRTVTMKEADQTSRKDKLPLENILHPLNRIPRPDAMAHYPFADDGGRVTDVLAAEESGKFLEMGIPAQKKVVKRIFEELKSGVHGVLVTDLPEAIKVSPLATDTAGILMLSLVCAEYWAIYSCRPRACAERYRDLNHR